MLYFPLDPSLRLKRIDSKSLCHNKENYNSVSYDKKSSSIKKPPKPNNEKQLSVLQYHDEDIFHGNVNKSTEMLKQINNQFAMAVEKKKKYNLTKIADRLSMQPRRIME